MNAKDRLVSWFVKNIEIPSTEILDKPGFVVTQFSEKKQFVFLREIFFPESVFAEIEKAVEARFGREGEEALYHAGKKFGVTYSEMSLFPKMAEGREKELEGFLYLFVRYMESMWSENVSHTFDFKSKLLEIDADNFIVCRKNGLGRVVSEGTGAGFWSYLMDDSEIEGTQTSCQGRATRSATWSTRQQGTSSPRAWSTRAARLTWR